MKWAPLWVFLCACGGTGGELSQLIPDVSADLGGVPRDDGKAPDLAAMNAADLAGADFSGADLSDPPRDFATQDGPSACSAGEPDDLCSQAEVLGSVLEGMSSTTARSLGSADVDTFQVQLHKGTHICVPDDPQQLVAFVTVSSATIQMNDDTSACSNHSGDWSRSDPVSICVAWTGTCGSFSDDRTVYFHVTGAGAMCQPYSVQVRFCAAGSSCIRCD